MRSSPHQFSVEFIREDPLRCIGQELRVAFACIGKLVEPSADNDFWLRKCRQLCLRPAIEPLLLGHWEKLQGFSMTGAELTKLCSMLHGAQIAPRTGGSYGLWDHVRFEPPGRASSWWDDIQAAAARTDLNGLFPAYVFARTIFAHPYPDGNGRLARALVHAALARTGDYCAPFLPLAPAFYMNGAKVAAAVRALSHSGDWEPFNEVFVGVLRDAGALAPKVEPPRE